MLRRIVTLVVLIAIPSITLAQGAQARCRKPGAAFDLDSADLPVCRGAAPKRQPASAAPALPKKRSPASNAHPSTVSASAPTGDFELDELDALPAPRVQAAPAAQKRTPASSRMSFGSYMNSNSNHPAIASKRVLPQEAFKDYSKPAIISGSSLDTPSDDKGPKVGEVNAPPGGGASVTPGGGTGFSPAANKPATDTPITLPATYNGVPIDPSMLNPNR